MSWEQFEQLWQALWAYIYAVLAKFGYIEEEAE